MITEAPDGTITTMSRDCTGWYLFWGYLFYEDVKGSAVKICEGSDGAYYMNGGTSQFPLSTWVKGSKNDDGSLVFPSGQIVYQEYYEGEIYDYALAAMTIDIDDEGGLSYNVLDELVLTENNGTYTAEGLVWGVCEYYDGEWAWTGYGDENLVLSPISDVVPELPDGLAMETWSAFVDDFGWRVSVGFAGNKVYVCGIDTTVPDCVSVGEISDDGTVTFEAGQYLGVSDYGFLTYLYGGYIDEVWNEDYEDYDITGIVTGPFTMSYDADAKRLEATNVFITTNNKSDNHDEVILSGYCDNMTILYQQRNPEAKPANPTDLAFYDEWEYYGSNTFDFTIPQVDVEGTLLDAENLYYRMYVDDDVFTFYGDEYVGLPDDGLDMLPADYSNYADIWVSGTNKSIWLYFQGCETLGVQSVYMQPVEGGEPVMLESEIVTIETSGVKSVISDKAEVTSSVYYDLQGRRVDNPATGLYIRRDTRADGTVNAVKVAVR